jgi:PEP-CTERM motif-containing protein
MRAIWLVGGFIVAIAGTALFPVHASASLIDITYTGTLTGQTTYGSISQSPCGADPCNISGAFTLTYLFNTDLAAPGNFSLSQLTGSSPVNFSFVPPVGTATLSGILNEIIDPSVCNIAGCVANESDTASGGTTSQTVQYNFSSSFSASIQTQLFSNAAIPASILQPFSFSGTDIGTGSLLISSSPGSTCIGSNCTSDTLTIDSVSVTVTPLPGALPLFAAGLGAIGLLGWRRRRSERGVAAGCAICGEAS